MIGDYKLLGIEPTATNNEIKKAYGRVLRENHPNKNGTFDDNKVQGIMDAYKRITAQERNGPQNKVEQIRFGETMEKEFPPMNVMCDDMEQKMNDLGVTKSESQEEPYYSKMSYYVRRDGKVITKIQENANGNIREYEEYKCDGRIV
jgi:curved DNA-binding protein CbpA